MAQSSPSLTQPIAVTVQLAILNASSVVGRLLPSFFADRLGVYNMLVPSLLASAVVLFGMMFVRDFTGVIVFGSLYGFTSGACKQSLELMFLLQSYMCAVRYFVDPATPGPADDGDRRVGVRTHAYRSENFHNFCSSLFFPAPEWESHFRSSRSPCSSEHPSTVGSSDIIDSCGVKRSSFAGCEGAFFALEPRS